MGRHAVMAIQPAVLSMMLSEHSPCCSVGSILWAIRQESAQEGLLTVVTGDLPCGDGVIRCAYPLWRPWQVRFVYLVERVPIVRACLNSKNRVHDGIDSGPTHQHRYDPYSGDETALPVDGFPDLMIGSTAVDAGGLRGCFERFAQLAYVVLRDNVSGSWWTDPPST